MRLSGRELPAQESRLFLTAGALVAEELGYRPRVEKSSSKGQRRDNPSMHGTY